MHLSDMTVSLLANSVLTIKAGTHYPYVRAILTARTYG